MNKTKTGYEIIDHKFWDKPHGEVLRMVLTKCPYEYDLQDSCLDFLDNDYYTPMTCRACWRIALEKEYEVKE